MISTNYKCIFIHIPKTGGTSVERVLAGGGLNRFGKYGDLTNNFQQHWTMRELTTCNKGLPTDKYFKFAFMRNPWDRMISEYAFGLRWFGYEREISPHADNGMNLKQFLALEERYPVIEHMHWKPQCDFVLDEDGEQIVDYIGQFENLQRDFAFVSRALGLPSEELPHINYGVRREGHYTDYYDNETRDLIAERYRRDIEFLGYAFGD